LFSVFVLHRCAAVVLLLVQLLVQLLVHDYLM
jgi:hypothetical protein